MITLRPSSYPELENNVGHVGVEASLSYTMYVNSFQLYGDHLGLGWGPNIGSKMSIEIKIYKEITTAEQ